MQDILQEITSHKREEIERLYKKKVSLRDELLASDTGIIAEFKRRSPSKGWIKEDGKADEIPISYQQNGAAAISILTDEHYFGGHDEFITSARRSGVTIPILYKNFVIDEAQIYAAAICGASAILLIAACLTKARCKMLIDKAHDYRFESGGDIPVRGDVSLIKQAARILIENASKYTPEGGEIMLKSLVAEGHPAFSVQDSGIGISESDVPHIFERFYRADDSRSKQTGGSGLGLAIAKWIVERHGGRFEIISRKDIGTRITVILP